MIWILGYLLVAILGVKIFWNDKDFSTWDLLVGMMFWPLVIPLGAVLAFINWADKKRGIRL